MSIQVHRALFDRLRTALNPHTSTSLFALYPMTLSLHEVKNSAQAFSTNAEASGQLRCSHFTVHLHMCFKDLASRPPLSEEAVLFKRDYTNNKSSAKAGRRNRRVDDWSTASLTDWQSMQKSRGAWFLFVGLEAQFVRCCRVFPARALGAASRLNSGTTASGMVARGYLLERAALALNLAMQGKKLCSSGQKNGIAGISQHDPSLHLLELHAVQSSKTQDWAARSVLPRQRCLQCWQAT